MSENPNKMRISRRDLVVGAGAAAAASAIPQGITAKPTAENIGPIHMEEWKPVTLKEGQIVRLTGLEHSADSFVANFKGIHDRIKNSKLMLLEGSGLVGTDVAEIAAGMSEDRRFIEHPGRLMHALMTEGRYVEFDVFYGALAGTALLENKRVFEVEPLYGISSEVINHVLSAAGTLHMLSKKSQQAPHQLLRNASAISVLSYIKERMVEGVTRAGLQGAHEKLLEFDNAEILRLAWSLSDWRDLRTAIAIKSMPARLSGYWQKGDSAQIFRGSDHGPGLTHYLKSAVESETKRLTYPHFEIVTALTGSSPRDDVREITRAGVRAL